MTSNVRTQVHIHTNTRSRICVSINTLDGLAKNISAICSYKFFWAYLCFYHLANLLQIHNIRALWFCHFFKYPMLFFLLLRCCTFACIDLYFMYNVHQKKLNEGSGIEMPKLCKVSIFLNNVFLQIFNGSKCQTMTVCIRAYKIKTKWWVKLNYHQINTLTNMNTD